jgi:hypothetical protein
VASSAAVRVLVLGGEAGPGEGLVQALGQERAVAVRRLLVGRARGWAEGAFGADAVRVVEEESFAAALSADDPADASAGDPADARADAGADDPADAPRDRRPVIAIVPELPVWHRELAAAVLGDLRDGCALALAPIFDRGLYLLALADPSADGTAALKALDLAGPGGMAALIGLAQREGWDVGLLRAERGLRRARDVHALLADPLTDPELRALLG